MKTAPTFFSLVVPESDFVELGTRAHGLTSGGRSEHAAMLAAAMRAGGRRTGEPGT